MNKPPFEIEINNQNAMILIKLHGFWSVDEVARYFQAKEEASQSLIDSGISQDMIKMLIDGSDWDIQNSEVAKHMLQTNSLKVKTAAISNDQAIASQQAKRVASEWFQFFKNKRDAIHWLNNRE